MPSFFVFLPGPLLGGALSTVVCGGGLGGSDEGGGDVFALALNLGVSSGSASMLSVSSAYRVAVSYCVPSPRRLPARSCLLPAASARCFSRSFSFSRSSACLAVCWASALAFFPLLPLGVSSSESSSMVAFRDRAARDSASIL